MSPRQIAAFTFLAERRREREMHASLAVSALAASGDGKAVKKQLEEWENEQ